MESAKTPASEAHNAAFLISSRENIFERLTAILDFLKEQTSRSNVKRIKARYALLSDLYKDYNVLEKQILEYNSSVEERAKIKYRKERNAVDDLFVEIQEIYESLLETSQSETLQPTPQGLPKMPLPKFYGDFREWHSFKEAFDSRIHSTSMSAVDKLQRLRECLSGEPLKLIAHYSLSSNNYILAYQSLIERYDNPRIAANSYLHALLHFKPVATDSYAALKLYLSHHFEAVKAYRALSIDDPYDYLLFQICYTHLDKRTQRAFDEKYPVNEFPTYDSLIKFVQNELKKRELHNVESENVSSNLSKVQSKHTFNVLGMGGCDQNANSCVACERSHPLIGCSKFLEFSVSQRYELLKRHNLCFNCFRRHPRSACNSSKKCKKCGKSHHTLLHSGGNEKSKVFERAPELQEESENQNKVLTHTATYPSQNLASNPKSILLGTAQGYVIKSGGNIAVPVRMLLDPGSQVSCVTENLTKILNLKIQPKITCIKGVSDTAVQSKGRIDCTIYTTPKCTKGFTFNFLVLPTISAGLPEINVHESVKANFKKYKLADPTFDRAGKIDVLIGADYFYNIVADKRVIRGKPNGIPTEFGLVLIGEVPTLSEIPEHQSFSVTLDYLEQTLMKFWETEELKGNSVPQDEWCENFFKRTLKRTNTGRYVVALPFNCAHPDKILGTNRENALQRLLTMERRFIKNEKFRLDYKAFIDEYLELGHMNAAKSPSPYVIPHHAVFKDSTTTKLRVVFDGSNFSDRGNSLNQFLHKGPKLQRDIFITLSGFRKYKVALVADIKMMYRQVLVRESDRKYQHIFWRESPDENPLEFELNTVTYGLACSSYLAQRVVQQLVEDEGKEFPLAADTLRNQIYVDDIVAGGESVTEALQLYTELTSLLGRGGFFPRKWSSSSPLVLEQIPNEHKETPLQIRSEDDIMFKVLGVSWDPKFDAFTYQVEEFKGSPTKRTILSYIARMFDPLGWLAPFIFYCKHFMQLLWLEGLGWDDELPQHLQQQWHSTVKGVQCLAEVRIPRHIPANSVSEVQLIGFCDASERGFAAVLYLRCAHNDNVTLQLLGAKSKVAPVKPISIPRLELNAAYLLAKLFESFKPFLDRLPPLTVSLFSDSQVVLGWLRTPPHKLKTYVCNRVVEILNKTSPSFWGHVSSEENAADCASRGLEPQQLLQHSLWWSGPKFLYQRDWKPSISVVEPHELTTLPELKQICVATVEVKADEIIKIMEKFSSLTKVGRVFAYVLRFTKDGRQNSSHLGSPSVTEINHAIKRCIWATQMFYFSKERALLKEGLPVKSLAMLSPFLDEGDLVRVGGRLSNAPLPYDTRHPILIPYKSHIARLIANYFHKLTLHGGPQITRSAIQARFWIPKIGNLIKSIIFACTVCRRHNAKPITPLMGDLPPSRFDQVRAFLRVGTDFAGPFTLKETPRRRAPLFKSYICLFICFSTKAVHIEIVSSLTTDAFLAAFDRFVARRGLCTHIYSDNGTNFTGAARALKEVSEFLSKNATLLHEQLTTRQVQWSFNPPSAPHFGGLWEAAVKSFKFHLNRVSTTHTFTLEEFSTVVCRIEAILNSRPLCLLTSPSDGEVFLTPGHFLIGAPLLALPELPLTDLKLNRLSRWQLIAQCVQNFWKTWSKSYLHTLLPRKKWQVNQEAIKVGDVVFVRNEKTNPLSWPLARVEQLLEGKDGVCRVVKIRCSDRILTRPVHLLTKVFENEIM